MKVGFCTHGLYIGACRMCELETAINTLTGTLNDTVALTTRHQETIDLVHSELQRMEEWLKLTPIERSITPFVPFKPADAMNAAANERLGRLLDEAKLDA